MRIGNKLKITLGGESHGDSVYVIAEGLPSGITVSLPYIKEELLRRSTGRAHVSARKELDKPIFEGLLDGKTTDKPLIIKIENIGFDSSSYEENVGKLRPSHADFPAAVKGLSTTGGGSFSARLTAPLVALGAIVKQYLETKGIYIGSHILSVGNLYDDAFDAVTVDNSMLKKLTRDTLPVLSDEAKTLFIRRVDELAATGDSIGGVIECAVIGLPVGIGGAYWNGLESKLANILFGIPAVKGVEFGAGYYGSTMTGSAYNDELYMSGDEIKTRTNHAGGILGGMSDGMPIVFSVAFKPTPSISKEQNTVDYATKTNCKLSIKGNHDVCVVLRAAPIVEAAAAIALLDAMLEEV